jgi:hypothetical protein
VIKVWRAARVFFDRHENASATMVELAKRR